MLKYTIFFALVGLAAALPDNYNTRAYFDTPKRRQESVRQQAKLQLNLHDQRYQDEWDQIEKVLKIGDVSRDGDKCSTEYLKYVDSLFYRHGLSFDIYHFVFYNLLKQLDICEPEIEAKIKSAVAQLPAATKQKLDVLTNAIAEISKLKGYQGSRGLWRAQGDSFERRLPGIVNYLRSQGLSPDGKGKSDVPSYKAELLKHFEGFCSDVVSILSPATEVLYLETWDQAVAFPWSEYASEWHLKSNVCNFIMQHANGDLAEKLVQKANEA